MADFSNLQGFDVKDSTARAALTGKETKSEVMTYSAYQALAVKDPNTSYYVPDAPSSSKIYRQGVPYGGDGGGGGGDYNPYVEYGPTWWSGTATVAKITIPATERLNMISVGDTYTGNIQIQGRNFLEPNAVYIQTSYGDPYMRHITAYGVTFFWNYDGKLEVSGTYNRSSRADISIAKIQMTTQVSMKISDIFADNTTFVVKAYGLTGNYADVNIGYQKTGNTIEYHPITETFTFKKSDLYFPSAQQSPNFYISLPPQQEVDFSCYLQVEEGSTPSGMFMPFFNLYMIGNGPYSSGNGQNTEDIIDSRFFVSNMIDITGLIYIWATGEHPNYKVITTTDKNADDITISRIRAVTGVTLGAESGSKFSNGTFTTDASKQANLNISVLSHMWPKKIYLTYTPNANTFVGDRYISTNRYGTSTTTCTFLEIPRSDFIFDSPNTSSTPMVSITTTGSASQTFKYRATEYYGDTYTEREMT